MKLLLTFMLVHPNLDHQALSLTLPRNKVEHAWNTALSQLRWNLNPSQKWYLEMKL